MNIEIVTTNKKLTMGIVKQMQWATGEDFHHIDSSGDIDSSVLGYVNGFKDRTRIFPVIILKGLNDWKIFPFSRPKSKDVKDTVYTNPDGSPMGNYEYRFVELKKIEVNKLVYNYKEDGAKRDKALAVMNKCYEIAKNTHIYL